MNRIDGRTPEQARPIKIETNFVRTAAGSCLIATGNTRVICTASVEETVPPFLKGKGQGWITAEYAMLPASTGQRKKRDGIKKDGRSVEIQRLIGRSLRQAVDLTKLGERTITLDCDVLESRDLSYRCQAFPHNLSYDSLLSPIPCTEAPDMGHIPGSPSLLQAASK